MRAYRKPQYYAQNYVYRFHGSELFANSKNNYYK